MATLVAHIRIRPGGEERWEAVMTEMVEKTLATEENVVRYEYWKRQAPREYFCLLAFRDSLAFFEHQAADYHVNAPFGDLIEAIELEWVDPVEGASPLARTLDPPLGSDVPKDVSAWREQTPVQLADWWSERR